MLSNFTPEKTAPKLILLLLF